MRSLLGLREGRSHCWSVSKGWFGESWEMKLIGSLVRVLGSSRKSPPSSSPFLSQPDLKLTPSSPCAFSFAPT
jgi:hypothetical protein